MALELYLEEYHELAVITLEGALLASNADYLQNAVTLLLEDGYSRIVIDCEDLISMNSDGLAVLSDLVRELSSRESEGRLVLCNVSTRIRGLIHLSGLDQFLETVSGKNHAIDRVMH
ncbi:STAS domain-containing protein [Parendozoicomonas haliclonae]|uniref:Anti-sigma factor antagonist n=1 Tax=Parendozoicomonas haliclonae TaxID=1960125 RepID=A0A1X7AEH7_9GAMM|nr:STAS domain-containing protein [Parendozoicomonas haliclonae]SMA34572.1 putative anti-sigma factor antagonist BtrV [Parendozoicomonas haliclonae]